MKALEKLVHLNLMDKVLEHNKQKLLKSIYLEPSINEAGEEDINHDALYAAVGSVRELRDAKVQWNKIPKDKRYAAQRVHEWVLEYMVGIANSGPGMSGEVYRSTVIGSSTTAYSETTVGERYSSRCSYKKTNVHHCVSITAKDCEILYAYQGPLSWGADNRIIQYNPKTHSCLLVETRNKRLVVSEGYFVFSEPHKLGAVYDTLVEAERRLARQISNKTSICQVS